MADARKQKAALLTLTALLEQNMIQTVLEAFLEKEDPKLSICAAFVEAAALLLVLKSAHLQNPKRAAEIEEYSRKGVLERFEKLESYFAEMEDDIRSINPHLGQIELALSQAKRALEEGELQTLISTIDVLFETLGISSEEMDKELSEANILAQALVPFLTENAENEALTTIIQI